VLAGHGDVPTVFFMSGRLDDASRDLAHAMRRLVHGNLAGMFDAPSTVAFDPNSPMLTIDLSRLSGSGDDTALVLAMTCASAWMESAAWTWPIWR
jgi:hypothetical protein